MNVSPEEIKIISTQINTSEDVEQKEPSFIVGGNMQNDTATL